MQAIYRLGRKSSFLGRKNLFPLPPSAVAVRLSHQRGSSICPAPRSRVCRVEDDVHAIGSPHGRGVLSSEVRRNVTSWTRSFTQMSACPGALFIMKARRFPSREKARFCILLGLPARAGSGPHCPARTSTSRGFLSPSHWRKRRCSFYQSLVIPEKSCNSGNEELLHTSMDFAFASF